MCTQPSVLFEFTPVQLVQSKAGVKAEVSQAPPFWKKMVCRWEEKVSDKIDAENLEWLNNLFN